MRQPVRSLPSLNCFRAAAELESFTLAGERLNLSHGAISRAVRLLEEDLGTTLFERRNRRVFLTEDGERLLRAVSEGLERIEREVTLIRTHNETRPLTLSCEPTLMMRWLLPRLPAFQEQNPEIPIHLVAGGGPVRLGNGIDLAIRRDDFAVRDGLTVSPLFDEETGPVCRPDKEALYFHTGSLLPEAPRLHTKTRLQAWAHWGAVSGCPVDDAPGQTFEHFYFSLQAAVAGLGVAIGPRRQVQDDLESGLLCAPMGFHKDGSSYVLLSAAPIESGSQTETVLNWLGKIAG